MVQPVRLQEIQGVPHAIRPAALPGVGGAAEARRTRRQERRTEPLPRSARQGLVPVNGEARQPVGPVGFHI
ncbi:UPF0291 protein SAMEA3545305_01382, partial [Dysosmobacter welbionis]